VPHTFELDAEITSISMTPNGAFIIAGASDGTVRLFSMLPHTATADRNGSLIGQIPAKGLHTVLHVHVSATEDCRFAFAGVDRGSAQMFAFDLSKLPTWASPTVHQRTPVQTLLHSHVHNDAKLKGLCVATRVVQPYAGATADSVAEYHLVCGRGIKNIHIWSFAIAAAADAQPTWSLLHDLATNGMTVELAGFRRSSNKTSQLQVYSKSKNQKVRMWECGPDDKPTYRDVENSADAAVVLDDFALGGGEQLSLVRIDADAVVNRMELALPSSSAPRGRRCMRTLQHIVGTQDGAHVVVFCSDSSIYHYDREATASSALKPLPEVRVPDEGEMVVTVALASVPGSAVLMTASSHGKGRNGTGALEVNALNIGGAATADPASFWAAKYVRLWPSGLDFVCNPIKADLQPKSAAKSSSTQVPESAVAAKGMKGSSVLKDGMVPPAPVRGLGRSSSAPLSSAPNDHRPSVAPVASTPRDAVGQAAFPSAQGGAAKSSKPKEASAKSVRLSSSLSNNSSSQSGGGGGGSGGTRSERSDAVNSSVVPGCPRSAIAKAANTSARPPKAPGGLTHGGVQRAKPSAHHNKPAPSSSSRPVAAAAPARPGSATHPRLSASRPVATGTSGHKLGSVAHAKPNYHPGPLLDFPAPNEPFVRIEEARALWRVCPRHARMPACRTAQHLTRTVVAACCRVTPDSRR
jgi:hypothetical protein